MLRALPRALGARGAHPPAAPHADSLPPSHLHRTWRRPTEERGPGPRPARARGSRHRLGGRRRGRGRGIPLELPRAGGTRAGRPESRRPVPINSAGPRGGAADWAARPFKCGGRCPLAARGHIRPARGRGGGQQCAPARPLQGSGGPPSPGGPPRPSQMCAPPSKRPEAVREGEGPEAGLAVPRPEGCRPPTTLPAAHPHPSLAKRVCSRRCARPGAHGPAVPGGTGLHTPQAQPSTELRLVSTGPSPAARLL